MRKLACGLFGGLFACLPAAGADDLSVYRASIPGVAPHSALIGIKLTIRSSRVYRLVDCPAGWSINVLNDPDWTTTLDAQAVVAAAAITSREASTMILVAAMPSADALPDAGPISATGELTTMRYGSGDTSTIKVTRVELVRYVPTKQ